MPGTRAQALAPTQLAERDSEPAIPTLTPACDRYVLVMVLVYDGTPQPSVEQSARGTMSQRTGLGASYTQTNTHILREW